MPRATVDSAYAADVIGASLIMKIRAIYRRDPTDFAAAFDLLRLHGISAREQHAMRLLNAINLKFQRIKSSHMGTSGLVVKSGGKKRALEGPGEEERGPQATGCVAEGRSGEICGASGSRASLSEKEAAGEGP